jgi:hypothetical protein
MAPLEINIQNSIFWLLELPGVVERIQEDVFHLTQSGIGNQDIHSPIFVHYDLKCS